MTTEPVDPSHPMHIYVMGWLSGLLPKAWMTPSIKVTDAETLSDTTLLITLSSGAQVRLGVEYLPNEAVEIVTPEVKVNLTVDAQDIIEGIAKAQAEAKKLTAVDIAKLYDVPPGLVGIDKSEYQGNWTDPPQEHPVPDAKKTWSPAQIAMGGLEPAYAKPKYKPVSKWQPAKEMMGVQDTSDAVDLADEVPQYPQAEVKAVPENKVKHLIEVRIQNWLNKLNTLSSQYFFSIQGKGSIYSRVVAQQHMSTGNTQSTVHAFVNMSTGQVFKPATWKAPAAGPRYDVIIQGSYLALMKDCEIFGSYLYAGSQSYKLDQQGEQ